MGKHTKPAKPKSIAGSKPVIASQIAKKYRDRLDWHEKIVTGARQEKNPDEPIVWPYPDTLRSTQD